MSSERGQSAYGHHTMGDIDPYRISLGHLIKLKKLVAVSGVGDTNLRAEILQKRIVRSLRSTVELLLLYIYIYFLTITPR